jgi:glutathione synthase/RimK-type ligase-like ATP-grasp enzyme
MILVVGIPSETPIQMVRDRLDDAGVAYITLNQRLFARCRIAFEVRRGVVTGSLTLPGGAFPLEDVRGVYTRMMDDRNLPELRDQPPDSVLRKHCRGFHEALTRWMEITPAHVINRCAPMGSNSSKPYQTQLIKDHGFRIPETLMTSDPELVRDFLDTHKRVIFKSASAMRSIVQTLGEADLERIENIRWCPTQFQAFVEGTNVRVHAIGDRVYATAVSTDATDYRYARRQIGQHAELREVDLSADLAGRCVGLASALGLGFAGIDLKITPDDEVYCFEVNPSPAFSYYESNTGQPISEGVAAALMQAERGQLATVN